MQVLGKQRRSRWLPVTACLTAAVAAAVIVASGVAPPANSAAGQAAPVIDPDYLYAQLFSLGYDDVYRVSGADGDPRNFADPYNLPSTINGWQEFWKQFKTQLTDTSAMGDVAKFATASDHYFRRSPEQRTNPNYAFDPNYRFDSNDAEVTIPGASCPGVRVLIAAHGDLTPVSPTIVGEINNPTSSTSAVDGFNAARRHITLSNLSNGGAYDDTSGVAMTMAEYQALLRWYAANGTYPSKTFKVTLLDADAGRAKDGTYMREGSQYYAQNLVPKGPQGQYAMFAAMNANGASYPAYHFGTQYYWNNVATGGVGPWHTFITDTPSAPNSLYPDTGGAIAGNSAAISAFDADLKAAVTAGFSQQSGKYSGSVKQENPLRYNGTGSAPGGISGNPQLPQTPTVPAYTASDQATYSPVNPAGTAPEAQILSTEDPAAAFFAAGIPGFSVGGVQDTNSVENPYPSTTSDAIKATPVIQHMGGTSLQIGNESSLTGGMTTLTAASAVGDDERQGGRGHRRRRGAADHGRHRLQPRGRADRVRRHRRRDRHRRDPGGTAEVRACERCAVPGQRGPARRYDRRLDRAPQHVGVRRSAWRRRRDAAHGRTDPCARTAGDLHRVAGQQLEVPRCGHRAEGHRCLLRDEPGQPGADQDRQLRRELRPWL